MQRLPSTTSESFSSYECAFRDVGNISSWSRSFLSGFLPEFRLLTFFCFLFVCVCILFSHSSVVRPLLLSPSPPLDTVSHLNNKANHVWYWLCRLSNGRDPSTVLPTVFFFTNIKEKRGYSCSKFSSERTAFLSMTGGTLVTWNKSNYPPPPVVTPVIMLRLSRTEMKSCFGSN